jgi:hypothetical protein
MNAPMNGLSCGGGRGASRRLIRGRAGGPRFLLILPSFLLLAVFLLFPCVAFAQRKTDPTPPPLSPAEGERLAQSLLSKLLALKPEESSTNSGLIRINDAQGRERQLPLRFGVVATPTNWSSVYEAVGTAQSPAARLTITHDEGLPSRYSLSHAIAPGGALASDEPISRSQLMVPFAGSDFWMVDLSLDFLHWPQQRVLKQEMKSGMACDVLQSVNPEPVPGAYSRVKTWIAINQPDDIVIVYAEAYDANDKLLKEFAPKKLKRVNGYYQPKLLEIRNVQTDSTTDIEVDFGQ